MSYGPWFDNINFNRFSTSNLVTKSIGDPDINLLNENQNLDTPHLTNMEIEEKSSPFKDLKTFDKVTLGEKL